MDQSSPPAARLGLLGGFRLRFGDEELRVSQPAQRLLSLLAVCHAGRAAERSVLAEDLWPDAPHGRATSSLRSVLWRLPRPRGRALVLGTATEVRLSPDVTVDLWDAEHLARRWLVEAPAATELDELELLAQDLLPHCHDEWLTIARESYRQQRLHALERAADTFLHRGRYPDALVAGLGAVRAEPLRESAHRRVIEVHLAEGNHAEALRQYDGYRKLLAAELGIPPSPAIHGLVAPLLGRPTDGRRRTRAQGQPRHPRGSRPT